MATSEALAAEPAATAESEAAALNDESTLDGLEVSIRPGFGAAGANSPVTYEPAEGVQTTGDPGELLKGASPYGLGFVGHASLGFRAHPFVSFGLRAGIRTASAAELTDGSSDLSRFSWDAGLYIRGYPLARSKTLGQFLDPWISAGAVYIADTQSHRRPFPTSNGGAVVADFSLDHHAIAVPLAVGVDYRIDPRFSIGPSFEYTIAAPIAGCWGVSASGVAVNKYCSNSDPGKLILSGKSYGVWSLGLDLRVTLF